MNKDCAQYLVFFLTSWFFLTDLSAAPLRGNLAVEEAQNYRLLSVAASGATKVANISEAGNFQINVSRGASLQLLTKNGNFFGPIVYNGKSFARPQVTGMSGNVGTISVKSGFATIRRQKKRDRLFLSKRVPFTSSNGTLGSGKLGLVERTSSNSSVTAQGEDGSRPGLDADKDGIINAFDVDDNGDLTLDGVDSNAFVFSDLFPVLFSTLSVEMTETLNINAGNVTQTEIDNLVQNLLSLVFILNPNGAEVSSVDLDCSDLAYCNPTSGSGVIRGPQNGIGVPIGQLLRDFDENENGLPDLAQVNGEEKFEIGFFPRVDTSAISSGDTYLFVVDIAGKTRTLPISLPYYFVTTTALAAFNDGSGEVEIDYPISNGDPGTPGGPIALQSSSVQLKLWRPQRPAIPGAESGSYRDMGGLAYGVYIAVNSEVYRCAPADYSNPSPDLEFLSSAEDTQTSERIFKDQQGDQEPDAEQTLSFTLDLDSCLTRNGVSSNGTRILIDILASDDDRNNTFQHVHFQLP